MEEKSRRVTLIGSSMLPLCFGFHPFPDAGLAAGLFEEVYILDFDAFIEGLKAIKADGTVDKLVAKYWGSAN